MPGLETSMYHTTPVERIDPLEQLSRAAGIQNSLNQNVQFQRMLRANQAMGDIIRQSIDPKTGQPDLHKAGIMMAAHPDTTPIAAEWIKQQAEVGGLQLDNTRRALELSQKRAGMIADSLAPLIAKGNGESYKDEKGIPQAGLSQQDIFRAIAINGATHNLSPEIQHQYASSIGYPRDKQGRIIPGAPYDPKLAWQDVTQIAQTQAGAAKNYGDVNERIGQVAQQGDESGLPPGTPYQKPAGTVPGAILTNSAAGGGAGGITTALDPTYAARLEDLNKNYVPDLQKRAETSVNLGNALREMRSLANNFTTGAGTELRTKLANIAASMAPEGAANPVVKAIQGGDVSSAQAFNKLATTAATLAMGDAFRQGGSGAPRAALEWERFQRAFPNFETEKGAMNKMFDFMQFQQGMHQRELETYNKWREHNAARQKSGGTQVDLTNFPSYWSTKGAPSLSNLWFEQNERKNKGRGEK
jgi:hypothetical protein